MSEQSAVRFAIRGPIARPDLPWLCERVSGLLAMSEADVALCDVCGVDTDAVTVDALARLQLAARRHGCQVRLQGASDDLRDLVAFMGLRDVLPELRHLAGPPAQDLTQDQDRPSGDVTCMDGAGRQNSSVRAEVDALDGQDARD